MGSLHLKNGVPVDARNPFQVDDVSCAMDKESVTGESVTFVTGAAGFTGLVSLDKRPIANLSGEKVGSFWAKDWNISTGKKGSDITIKSINANTIVLTSPTLDLEELYETPSGTLEYIIKIADTSGLAVYGWIKGIAESNDVYTLDVYTEAAGTTQGWVGGLGVFDTVGVADFNIYRNQTSLSWTTGTVLTREVDLPDDIRDLGKFLDNLSLGDYAVDYERGTIYYKKATTGTSDTAAYTINTNRTTEASGSGAATSLAIIDDWDATHDSAVSADGPQTMLEAKTYDGSALPNTVGAEGDAVRAAGSLSGVNYFIPVNQDGSASAVGNTKTISVSPTVDTDAYTAGDIVGGIQTITSAAAISGGSGVITGLTLIDMSMQNVEYDIIVFQQNPSNGTYTDDLAIDVHDTDADFIIGTFTVSPGHYVSFTDNSVATLNNINLPFTTVGTANLFAIAVTRGTPTYAAATDVQLRFKIAQD